MIKLLGLNGGVRKGTRGTPMARPGAKVDNARAAALNAALKAMFAAVEAEPAPERFVRHIESLERDGPARTPRPKRR